MTFVGITPERIEPRRWAEVLASPIAEVAELGAVVVTDYDLIREVLRDDQRFGPAVAALARPALRRLAREDPDVLDRYRRTRARPIGYAPALIQAEGDAHSQHRVALGEWFSPQRLVSLRPQLDDLAGRLWAAAAQRPQPIDVRTNFSEPFSLAVLTHALGLPVDDAEQLGEWSHAIFLLRKEVVSRDEFVAGTAARQAVHDYFTQRLAVAREQSAALGRPQLLDALARRLDGAHSETVSGLTLDILQQLLVAGNESTAATLPGIVALALGPAPTRWTDLDVDELTTVGLRLCHSSRAIARLATRDTELGGLRVRRNQLLWLHLDIANRDPRYFPGDPLHTPGNTGDTGDEGDTSKAGDSGKTGDTGKRPNRPHLAFGHGSHRCVGANLATIEIRTALAVLARDYPSVRLVDVSWPEHYDLALRAPDKVLIDLTGAET
jgi:cytochrome P450